MQKHLSPADGAEFIKIGRFRGFRENSGQGRTLVEALLPDPDRLFAEGEPVRSPWHSASTDKVQIEVAGHTYFVKRYNCLGLGYRLKNVLRLSKALRSWHNGRRLLQAQLPTVPPLICFEERCVGLLGRSYIVFPHLRHAVSLLDGWLELCETEQAAALLSLAETIGRMHRQGVYHGDLNWRNILLQRDDGQLRFLFVDLDGCRYRSGYVEALARRDLKHFYRDMGRAEVTAELKEKFRLAWSDAAGA